MIDRNLLSIKLLALTNINKGGVDAKKLLLSVFFWQAFFFSLDSEYELLVVTRHQSLNVDTIFFFVWLVIGELWRRFVWPVSNPSLMLAG